MDEYITATFPKLQCVSVHVEIAITHTFCEIIRFYAHERTLDNFADVLPPFLYACKCRNDDLFLKMLDIIYLYGCRDGIRNGKIKEYCGGYLMQLSKYYFSDPYDFTQKHIRHADSIKHANPKFITLYGYMAFWSSRDLIRDEIIRKPALLNYEPILNFIITTGFREEEYSNFIRNTFLSNKIILKLLSKKTECISVRLINDVIKYRKHLPKKLFPKLLEYENRKLETCDVDKIIETKEKIRILKSAIKRKK